jgi:hypothetical protein
MKQSRHPVMSTFCDGMGKKKCGCILTPQLKSSTAHIHNITDRCQKLPLQFQDIQTFIGKIGLKALYNTCNGTWQLGGPLYESYLHTKNPKHTTDDLIQLCKTLWTYTSHGIPSYPGNTLSPPYIEYYATFRTIISEMQQFHDTYPLPPQEVDEQRDEPKTIIIIILNGYVYQSYT